MLDYSTALISSEETLAAPAECTDLSSVMRLILGDRKLTTSRPPDMKKHENNTKIAAMTAASAL